MCLTSFRSPRFPFSWGTSRPSTRWSGTGTNQARLRCSCGWVVSTAGPPSTFNPTRAPIWYRTARCTCTFQTQITTPRGVMRSWDQFDFGTGFACICPPPASSLPRAHTDPVHQVGWMRRHATSDQSETLAIVLAWNTIRGYGFALTIYHPYTVVHMHRTRGRDIPPGFKLYPGDAVVVLEHVEGTVNPPQRFTVCTGPSPIPSRRHGPGLLCLQWGLPMSDASATIDVSSPRGNFALTRDSCF